MATSITQTSEQSQAGMDTGGIQQQEASQVTEATRFSFDAEQRKLLAQTYQMILSWAKLKPQSNPAVDSNVTPGTKIETRS